MVRYYFAARSTISVSSDILTLDLYYINSMQQEKVIIKEIALKPGVYNLAQEVSDSINNKQDIDNETLNILATFNGYYDLALDIEKRGSEKVQEEMSKALEEFDFEKAKEAVKSGLARAQGLNPQIPLNEFPVIFLYVPTSEDAKSLHGQGCGININSFCGVGLNQEEKFKRIESLVAHESTHIFLKQLGLKPPNNWTGLEDFICNFLWEEGLTTYMETENYSHHERFIADSDFWIHMLYKWIILDRDDPKKQNLLKACIDRESTQAWLKDIGFSIGRIIPETDDIDRKFIFLITKMNGAAYHIGKHLWDLQIQKGNNLTELVAKGSHEMKDWLKSIAKDA